MEEGLKGPPCGPEDTSPSPGVTDKVGSVGGGLMVKPKTVDHWPMLSAPSVALTLHEYSPRGRSLEGVEVELLSEVWLISGLDQLLLLSTWRK